MTSAIEVFRYQAEDGHEPFTEWLLSLRDKQAQARVRVRLRRLEAGLFGGVGTIGGGLFELKEHHGPGYRVYFGLRSGTLVLLLCGGTKSTQSRDIAAARAYWADWKRRQA